MWTSDGTDAGTVRLADIRPGALDSRPTHIAGFDGRVYFFAEDGTHGRELWSTDGTPAGTRLDQDIYPGPILSSTFSPIFPEPVATGNELFFVAQDDQAGRELRRLTGTPAPAVAGRHLFYNRSAFDGRNDAANVADDGAIAPDKAALLPGQAASFSNVSGYSRGINGVMIDIHGVTADLDADDFEFRVGAGGDPATWAPAPAPLSVTERVPPALAAPTRVTLVWADGVIRNRWLRVTVKANADTLLAQDDVFYFGSLVGEGGGDDSPAAPAVPLVVDGVDVVRTRAAISAAPAALTNPFDHDRDGRVSVADVALVRRNVSRALAPVAGPGAAASAAAAPTRGASPRRRGTWVGAATDVLR